MSSTSAAPGGPTAFPAAGSLWTAAAWGISARWCCGTGSYSPRTVSCWPWLGWIKKRANLSTEGDEKAAISELYDRLGRAIKVPIMIDSTDPEAIEVALGPVEPDEELLHPPERPHNREPQPGVEDGFQVGAAAEEVIAEGEAEKQAGDHADAARQDFLEMGRQPRVEIVRQQVLKLHQETAALQ